MIIKSNEGYFRGVSFDVSKEEVLKTEAPVLPVEEYDTYIRFHIKDEKVMKSGEFLEVDYAFNRKGKLDVMTAFYHSNDMEANRTLIKNLVAYFSKKYGESRENEYGWHEWLWTEENKGAIPGEVEFVLSVEDEEGYKGVSVEFVKYVARSEDWEVEESEMERFDSLNQVPIQ